ncbi:chemotaxis protein CheW [Paracoccus pacificus]|uniref:Chemotaxis protein CheW n=1 Tax=Paracoccus pacificus TaxID=1463598 RepID=A0ABW4R5Q8_9RHOB
MITSSDNRNGPEIELLSFRIAEQEYCVDIMQVREIRGWTKATPLPFAPPYVKGVINLRGTVLPVIDLSARLGMAPACGDARNVVIVVQLRGHTAGLLVEAVSDILAIAKAELQPPPDAAIAGSGGYINALTLVEDRLIRVLDLSAIFAFGAHEAA